MTKKGMFAWRLAGNRMGAFTCAHIFVAALLTVMAADRVCSSYAAETSSVEKGGTTVVQGEKPDIVIIGASYAEGLGIPPLQGRKVVNKGVGGEQSHEMLGRFERDVVELGPSQVIIWGFINDIFRSNPAEAVETRARIEHSFKEMVRLSRENGITPIVATEITTGPTGGIKERVMGFIYGLMGRTSYQEKINRRVMEVNDWLKEYAVSQKITMLDLQKVLADGKGLNRKRKYTKEDGSHVSVEGYEALVTYLEKAGL